MQSLLLSQATRASETSVPSDFLPFVPMVETKSNIQEMSKTETSPLPFGTDFVDDLTLDYGEEEVVSPGKEGRVSQSFRVTYWQGKEVHRVLERETVIPPQNQQVLRGRKVTWKELVTGDRGTIRYWRKLRVWATSYDGNCAGCRGRTFSGTSVQIGTCAVDPRVIVLGSHFYVPGYSLCSALDIGGAIKGNKVDLGFPDVAKGWWSARFVDIYLLDGEPKSL